MENIQVYLRLRPRNEAEILAEDAKIWEMQENTVVTNNQLYEDLISKTPK